MANPFDLTSDDPFTAALQHARAGYAGKSRAALMDKPEPNADVQSLDLDNPSAFESILKTVGLGGYGVRNILKGNIEGAGRNLVDLISSPLRAVLPGDQSSWELSRQEDLPEFSDLIGGMEPGLGKTAVDVLGGIATDPLSFLGVGEFSAAAKAAKAANAAVKVARASGDVAKLAEAAKAAEVANAALKASRAAGETKTALGVGIPFKAPAIELPGSASALDYLGGKVGAGLDLAKAGIDKIPGGSEVLEGAAKFGRTAKYALGAVNPSDKVAADIAASEGLGGATSRAAAESPIAANAGVAKDVQEKAHLLIEDIAKNAEGVHEALGVAHSESAVPGFGSREDQISLIDQRLGRVGWDDATKAAVRDTAIRETDRYRDLYRQSIKDSILDLPAGAGDLSPLDYIPRQGDLKLAEEGATGEQRAAGLASMLKPRSLTEKSAFAEHLNKPGVALESNLGQVGASYGQQLGGAAKRADIARRTIGEFKAGATAAEDTGFKSLVDPASRTRMNDAIAGLRKAGQHDDAQALDVAFNGLPPAKGIWRVLSNINKPFKAAATAGVVVPRLNFTIGNTVSNVVQFMQDAEGRGVALKQLASLPKVIAGSIADGLKRLGVKALPESSFDELTKAAQASDGTRDGMMALIKDKNLKLAVQHGVLDGGFVSAEQMGTDFATKGDPKNWRNWAYWGQDIAKGSEQRMRYNGFVDLIEAGHAPADAARIVNSTLFDYKYTSVGNRNLRTVIPFGMYSMKAAPQAAKFLLEKPAAAVGLNALYSQNDANTNPLPPWLHGNINLPVGKGETGNPQYLTQLRMPFETLSKLPNPSGDLGDILADTQHDIAGQFSPLIKTGIAALGGNDSFTGQPFRSNDKAPALLESLGLDPHGEGARFYNTVAGTGAIQPIASIIGTLSKLLDKRTSVPVATLNSLTGLKIVDVDEQFALKQLIEDAIKRDPSIKSSANYYQLQRTPEGAALLQKLGEIRKQLKAQKAAAK